MRLEDLKLFLLVADMQNIHRVAEHRGMSQPAVTKALRRLEDAAGMKFFERTSRGMILTQVGAAFAARARRVDLELEQALRELEDMRFAATGIVRLGAAPPIIDTMVAPAVRQFLQRRPGVHFELGIESTALLLDRLCDGKLDLVMALVPADSRQDRLEHQVVHQQKMRFVVRKNHPLFDVPGARPSDLVQARWLLQPRGGMTRQWVESQLAGMGLPPPDIAVETNASAGLIASLIPGSELATLLNLSLIGALVGSQLVARDDILPPLVRPLAIFWRRDAYVSPLVRDFHAVLALVAQARSGSRAMDFTAMDEPGG